MKFVAWKRSSQNLARKCCGATVSAETHAVYEALLAVTNNVLPDGPNC
jgi:hypothetical protein